MQRAWRIIRYWHQNARGARRCMASRCAGGCPRIVERHWHACSSSAISWHDLQLKTGSCFARVIGWVTNLNIYTGKFFTVVMTRQFAENESKGFLLCTAIWEETKLERIAPQVSACNSNKVAERTVGKSRRSHQRSGTYLLKGLWQPSAFNN